MPLPKVSVVQYLNSVPLIWGMVRGEQQGRYDLAYTIPAACADAVHQGKADIGIVPSIEYQRIERAQILSGLSIASKSEAKSVLLLSNVPIEKVKTIAVDNSSRTSAALVRILMRKFYSRFITVAPSLPKPADMLKRADAALVIGDPALRISLAIEGRTRTGSSGQLICNPSDAGLQPAGAETLHVYDVAGEWWRLTGLPSVMAFWAARRDVATAEVVADFTASRDYGIARFAEISREASRILGLPAAALAAYLEWHVHYSLPGDSGHGLEHFFARCAALGLIPQARPIEWAPVPASVRAAK